MTNTDVANLIHDRHARGRTKIGWLDSYHTFSFGGFQDPNRMGFRSLRVINDDRVVPGAGFGAHRHRDMEIITYVLDGALEHADSLDNGAVIRPGDAQIMSAGTGIKHSEYNASPTEPVHFLQIWVIPNQLRIQPRYDQKHFPVEQRRGKLKLMFDPEAREEAIIIHQDVQIYASILEAGETVAYDLDQARYGWVQVARGILNLNGQELREGDGVQLLGNQRLKIETPIRAEFLLFNLA